MKNIYTLLEGIGVTLPEDKKADFEASFKENYKTVAELEKVGNARGRTRAINTLLIYTEQLDNIGIVEWNTVSEIQHCVEVRKNNI